MPVPSPAVFQPLKVNPLLVGVVRLKVKVTSCVLVWPPGDPVPPFELYKTEYSAGDSRLK